MGSIIIICCDIYVCVFVLYVWLKKVIYISTISTITSLVVGWRNARLVSRGNFRGVSKLARRDIRLLYRLIDQERYVDVLRLCESLSSTSHNSHMEVIGLAEKQDVPVLTIKVPATSYTAKDGSSAYSFRCTIRRSVKGNHLNVFIGDHFATFSLDNVRNVCDNGGSRYERIRKVDSGKGKS